jgi:hypothetical protein
LNPWLQDERPAPGPRNPEDLFTPPVDQPEWSFFYNFSGNITTYATSYVRLRTDPSFTYGQFTWVFTTNTMARGVFTAVGGFMERKLGPRVTTFIGCAIATWVPIHISKLVNLRLTCDSLTIKHSFETNLIFTISWTRAVKSNWNWIVFPYQIECFCPNWIKSYPNWIEWLIQFSIQFNSIRFWQKLEREKPRIWQKNIKNSQDRILKGIVRYLCLHCEQFFWKLVIFLMVKFSFMTADAVWYQIESFFESNRYRIEIESNRKVSATSPSKIKSNRNRFNLTALISSIEQTCGPSWCDKKKKTWQ